MDKTQADAIARAILDPQSKAQDESMRNMKIKAEKVTTQKRLARFYFIGFGAGFVASYVLLGHITPYVFVGGLLGVFIGLLIFVLRQRLHKPGAV